MAKATIQDRQVKGYLKPNNLKFFTEYVNRTGISKSAGLNEAVKALQIVSNPPREKHDF